MWLRVFLLAVGALIVGLVAAVFVSKSRLDRENARLVDELLADAGPDLLLDDLSDPTAILSLLGQPR